MKPLQPGAMLLLKNSVPMKNILSIIIASATAATAEPVESSLQPAKLQPASGLDMASGLGGRGSIRVSPDTAEAWKLRFPKQPNGRPR